MTPLAPPLSVLVLSAAVLAIVIEYGLSSAPLRRGNGAHSFT